MNHSRELRDIRTTIADLEHRLAANRMRLRNAIATARDYRTGSNLPKCIKIEQVDIKTMNVMHNGSLVGSFEVIRRSRGAGVEWMVGAQIYSDMKEAVWAVLDNKNKSVEVEDADD